MLHHGPVLGGSLFNGTGWGLGGSDGGLGTRGIVVAGLVADLVPLLEPELFELFLLVEEFVLELLLVEELSVETGTPGITFLTEVGIILLTDDFG